MARAAGLPAYMALRRLCRAAWSRLSASRFALAWIGLLRTGSSTEALAAKEVQLKALELQTARCAVWTSAWRRRARRCRRFTRGAFRLTIRPIDRRIGELALKGPVRLSRVQYSPRRSRLGPDGDFIGCGDYRQLPADHAVCEQHWSATRLFCDSRAFADRPAGRPGEPRLKVSYLAAAGDAAASGLPSTQQAGDASPATPLASQGKEGT